MAYFYLIYHRNKMPLVPVIILLNLPHPRNRMFPSCNMSLRSVGRKTNVWTDHFKNVCSFCAYWGTAITVKNKLKLWYTVDLLQTCQIWLLNCNLLWHGLSVWILLQLNPRIQNDMQLYSQTPLYMLWSTKVKLAIFITQYPCCSTSTDNYYRQISLSL